VLATRDGLEAGCDIDSGGTYSNNVATAVNTKVVNQSFVNACLYRSYKMRFIMGLFDPNVPNYYRNISTVEVGQPSYQAISLMASRKVGCSTRCPSSPTPTHILVLPRSHSITLRHGGTCVRVGTLRFRP
jgi:hypothetical protein